MNATATQVKEEKYYLTSDEIKNLKKDANFYYNLIQKELGYGNLANAEKLVKYNEAYLHCKTLISVGYIYLPTFN